MVRKQRSIHLWVFAVLVGHLGAFGCKDYEVGAVAASDTGDGALDAAPDVNALDGDAGPSADASAADGGKADGSLPDAPSDATVFDAASDAAADTGEAGGDGGSDVGSDAAVVIPQLAAAGNEIINVSTGGVQANADCEGPKPSADIRFVTFFSAATNLVANDTNGASDVFLRDRALGTTKVVSATLGGVPGNGASDGGYLTPSGLFVSFASVANNLVAGDGNGKRDVFLYNVSNGALERVSVSSAAAEGDGDSGAASVSNDGRYVAFESAATNLVVGDTNNQQDVFLRDRVLNTTLRVTVGTGGAQANGLSRKPHVSADGLFVAFESDATNLVTADTNGVRDVFIYSILSQAITRLSDTGSAQGNGVSERLILSDTSQFGIFPSAATNLVAGDTENQTDLFRVTTQSPRQYVRLGGLVSFPSTRASISNSGNVVAAETVNSFAKANDQNSASDIWAYNLSSLPPAIPVALSVSSGGNTGNGASTSPFLTSDGSHVVYRTVATNISGITDNNGALADIILNRISP